MAQYVPNPIKWIYSKIREAVYPLCPYTNTTAPTSKAKLPCHTVILIGSLTRGRTLEMDETGVLMTIQSDTYTNGERFAALNRAFEIDELAHQAYITLGFERIDGPREIPNAAEDETVKRVTSRYRRTITAYDVSVIQEIAEAGYDGGYFTDYLSGINLDGGKFNSD